MLQEEEGGLEHKELQGWLVQQRLKRESLHAS